MRVFLSLFLFALLPAFVSAHGHGVGRPGHVHHGHVTSRFALVGGATYGGVGSCGTVGSYAPPARTFSAPACGTTQSYQSFSQESYESYQPPLSAPLPSYGAGGCGTAGLGQLTTYQGVRGYFTTDTFGRRFFISGRHYVPIGHHFAFGGRLPVGVVGVGHFHRHGHLVGGHRPGFALRAPFVRLRIH